MNKYLKSAIVCLVMLVVLTILGKCLMSNYHITLIDMYFIDIVLWIPSMYLCIFKFKLLII